MVYIVLGEGFEEIEAITPGDLLRRAGVPVCYAGIGGTKVRGGHGILVEADCTVEQMDLTNLDMIVLPGGLGGVQSIRKSRAAMDAVEFAGENGKYVAAICAAPTILAELHLTDGKQAVCYPGMEDQMGSALVTTEKPAVQDGKVITGASAGCAVPFAKLLIGAMAGQEAAERVISAIAIREQTVTAQA